MSDTLTLFIPAANRRHILDSIRPGSAIVGSKAEDRAARGMWVIDYEGNVHGAANLKTFEERLQSAAGRHAQRYPTVARLAVSIEELVAVGEVRHSEALGGWFIESLHEEKALQLWIAPEELPRIGGSTALWGRAAAQVFAKQRSTIISSAAKRGDIMAAAYAALVEADPTLHPPA